MDLRAQILDFGRRARQAARALAQLESPQKNAALNAMADEVIASSSAILAANAADLARARENALAPAMVDRLTLDETRLQKIVGGIRQIASLPDPVGAVLRQWTQPNGIEITKLRVPIGVVGILRIATERHERRRGSLHQDRERDDSARRFRVDPLECRARRGAPARRRAGRRTAFSSSRRPIAKRCG